MSLADRLKEDLIEAGRIGRKPPKRIERYDQLSSDTGVTRVAGTEENRALNEFAVQRMRDASLIVQVDRIGNIFGRREGRRTGSGTVICGSHLDSVVNGGMFDGALGVFSAIEAIRRMNDEGFENERPLEVVVFTGEEGSAFKQTLLGSSVLTGKTELDAALNMKNGDGVTLREALEKIGYAGSLQRSLDDVEYMVELHVEQGPVLYEENIPIGIIENITGIAWIFVTIQGQENHAGTTPMGMRKDALVAASEVVSFLNRRVKDALHEFGGSPVGTVGSLTVSPNSTNVVPGKVTMGIDIRDVKMMNIEKIRNDVLEIIKALEKRYGVETSVHFPVTHRPTPLSSEVADTLERASRRMGIPTRRMNSGAGHDSQNMAEKVKTGMIFVPSINGISHSPMEWTEWEDVEKGAKVLTEALKDLSRLSTGT